MNRISRKIKWSLLLSRTSKPVVTPTTHEPGFFHNIKLNNLSIKELRSLRQIGSKGLEAKMKHLTDDQIAAELAEIAKRESAVVVQ